MHSRSARFAAAAGFTVAVASGGVLAGAGAANAATPAATPIVLGSCATSVVGTPGTPVALGPSAVVGPVTSAVQSVPLVGPTLATEVQSAFTALPPIPLGALPTGTGSITGTQVASAVVSQLNNIPLLGPVLGSVVGNVQSTLSSLCGVAMTGLSTVVAPVQSSVTSVVGATPLAGTATPLLQSLGLAPRSGAPGSTGGGPPAQTGAGTGGSTGGGSQLAGSNSPVLGGLSANYANVTWPSSLMGLGYAYSPLTRYAGLPFTTAGLFAPAPGVRYGGSVPGYTPGFGVLGQDGNSNSSTDGIQTAGHAEALGGLGTVPGGVGLPMLLAVLALSGVTAGLVRTWVLRRVPSA
jgi:hypothetical protein